MTVAWNSSPSVRVDTVTIPSVMYFCNTCPDIAEPCEIDVSTVSSWSCCLLSSVTSPLRFGRQRSLPCFQTPEKSGTVCGHATTVTAAGSGGISSRDASISCCFGFAIHAQSARQLHLPPRRRSLGHRSECQPQRELDLARRSRAHRGDRRHDARVYRVDDATEPRRTARRSRGGKVARSLRLT